MYRPRFINQFAEKINPIPYDQRICNMLNLLPEHHTQIISVAGRAEQIPAYYHEKWHMKSIDKPKNQIFIKFLSTGITVLDCMPPDDQPAGNPLINVKINVSISVHYPKSLFLSHNHSVYHISNTSLSKSLCLPLFSNFPCNFMYEFFKLHMNPLPE